MAFRTCLSCWPDPCISDIHPSDFQSSYLEKVHPNARSFRFSLWEPVTGHLMPKKDIPDEMFASPLESEQDLLQWCSEKVHFLDQSCEETTFERSRSMYDELCRDDKLAEVLICRHKEGSFNLSPGIVSQCLYVARVISLSSFLFCLRLAPFVYDDGSVLDHMSDLINELSSLSNKWKWSGEACKDAFSQWNLGFISECADDSEMQEALKLLYQMTCIPLESVFFNVEREMKLASIGGDEYAGALRVIKCGDELCNFLEDYRALFQLCGDIEFVYADIFDYHRRTAENHLVLGNHERATALLTMAKSMLDQIDDNLQGGQLVAIREVDGCKIAYLPPDPLTIFRQIWTIASLLIESTGNYNYVDDMKKSETKIDKEISDHKLEFEAYASEHNLITTRFDRQTYDIMRLIGKERYSEANEIFNQLDLKEGMLNSDLHHFLESVNKLFVKLYLSSGSALKWESLCQRQELLLDFSLAAGDRQLTAKFSEQYGITLAKHSYSKLFKRDIHNVQESSTSQLGNHDVSQGPADSEAQDAASRRKLWLKEELNLEITTPAPELLKEVTSWLSDPCTLDEHKRVDLLEMVKACRLLKHSIDIYSDLLLHWTQGSSNEAEWLRLLESQKTVHVTLQSHLLQFVHLCLQTLQDSNDPSLKVFSQYKTQVVDGSGTISSILAAFMISTLVWVERGRTRTLLYQLGPWYAKKHDGDAGKQGSLKEEFDKNEQAALSSILSCQLACQGEPLFIEYTTQNLSGTKAVAFMIHKDPKIHSRMFDCKSDEVEDLVTKFYSTISRQRKDASVVVEVEVHRILERLYDILIQPLSDQAIFKHLNPKATIVFVPDKILYRVPFALLRDRTTQKYLFQLHPIAIAPSLRVLQHCEQRLRTLDQFPLKPEGCILAVGNPSYETNLLPGTGKELEHLRSCFPNQVKTLEKDEATRGNFLELVEDACHSEEEYVFALIHLGVHGHWSKTSYVHKTGSLQFAKIPQHSDISSSNIDTKPGPSYTRQALEQGFGSDAAGSAHDVERYGSTSGELGVVMRSAGHSSWVADDMLPSEDIVKSRFQWRTRLVVLSACNSSRGQDYSDGEVNLPRALMIAGVPAAVVSQWEIGDSSSPILMKAFYENLKYGKDVASALQSAMLQLLSSDQLDIFGWGAFLIWGLPTVHLPQELWTENARKALVAKQHAESLRCLLDHVVDDNMRKTLVNEALKVHTFLDHYSATNAHDHCAQEVVNDAIFAIETLLGLLMRSDPRVSPVVIAFAEEVYMVVPFEQLERIELELEKRWENAKFIKVFRQHIMYTQATKGKHQRALDYAEKLIETSEVAKEHFIFRQERAVIWRLMGKYEDAIKEFNDLLLAHGDTYELLIQTSYVKHRMEDKRGTLEYAQRAKKLFERDLELSTMLGYGAFTLGFKALPNDYRQWLSNVDESTRAI